VSGSHFAEFPDVPLKVIGNCFFDVNPDDFNCMSALDMTKDSQSGSLLSDSQAIIEQARSAAYRSGILPALLAALCHILPGSILKNRANIIIQYRIGKLENRGF